MYTDRLCEPRNPGGWACWGWVALDADGWELASGHGCLGNGPAMTNNRAEYEAAIAALEWARNTGLAAVRLRTDSQLVVNQARGTWRCNAPHLRPLLARLRALMAETGATVEWVPRERNARADALSRRAYREVTGQEPPTRRRWRR